MDLENLKRKMKAHTEGKIPKHNGAKCKEGCNCIEIAEAKNSGQPVKEYPCLGY